MSLKKNKLIVQKYGGSSISTVERIESVAGRIASYRKKGFRLVVILSAMGNTTDNLISLARKINPYPQERELDMLISTGEQISISLLAMALHKRNIDAVSFTGHQIGILADKSHTKAKIVSINTRRLKKSLLDNKVIVVAGFQGRTFDNEIVTLGRGGSDLTAVAIASVLKADICEIYTDVDGIYTADPRIVKKAKKLDCISFEEMLELASLGAKVIQARAVEVAKKYNIPLHLRSSFISKGGTVIMRKRRKLEDAVIEGITLNEDEVKITICNVPDKPGMAAGIFKKLSSEKVNVDMIVQNVSHERITDISFTVGSSDARKALQVTRDTAKRVKAGNVFFDKKISKVSIVGVGMKTHSGVAETMFKALAQAKINIEMISTSEICISCVVKKKMGREAVRILHKAFGLDKFR